MEKTMKSYMCRPAWNEHWDRSTIRHVTMAAQTARKCRAPTWSV